VPGPDSATAGSGSRAPEDAEELTWGEGREGAVGVSTGGGGAGGSGAPGMSSADSPEGSSAESSTSEEGGTWTGAGEASGTAAWG
jgi:hypothetical protein